MATAGPAMGKLIVDALGERDIEFYPLKKTLEVDAERKLIRFEDGSDASYDLLIAIPPHEAPQVVRDAGLVGESGWLPVDPRTLRIKALPDVPVYAIGDVAAIPLPGRFKPDVPLSLPKAGTLAEGQGAAVATQIASAVNNARATEFDGRGFCFVELGGPLAMRAGGDFFARPNPVMHAEAPSEETLREKHQWLERWLGQVHPD